MKGAGMKCYLVDALSGHCVVVVVGGLGRGVGVRGARGRRRHPQDWQRESPGKPWCQQNIYKGECVTRTKRGK